MHTTNNEGYGYHGGLASTAWIRRQIDEAYSNTVEALIDNGIVLSVEEAKAFLDSRQGRHLADEISSAETNNEIGEIIYKKAPEHFRRYRAAL